MAEFNATQLAEIRAEINKAKAFPDLEIDLVTGKTKREVEQVASAARALTWANGAPNIAVTIPKSKRK